MLETFLFGPLFSITWDARPSPIDHNVLSVVTGTGERNNNIGLLASRQFLLFV